MSVFACICAFAGACSAPNGGSDPDEPSESDPFAVSGKGGKGGRGGKGGTGGSTGGTGGTSATGGTGAIGGSGATGGTGGSGGSTSNELFHTTPSDAFVDASGAPVKLNGMNMQPLWAGTTNTWSQEKYDQVKAKGFNMVRLVLFWNQLEPTQGVFDQAKFTVLDTAIARAKAAGLYVILDEIHVYGGQSGKGSFPSWAVAGGGDTITIIQRDAIDYIKYLATRYGNEPQAVAHDLVNEPFLEGTFNQTRSLVMYDTLIQAVRPIDPDKIIHIEPIWGNTDMRPSCVDWSKLTLRSNVALHVHDYFAGGDDDGFSSTCGSAGTHVWNGTTGYANASGYQAQMDTHILTYKNAALTGAGIPLFVGEYGIGTDVTNHDIWIQQKVAIFNKYGLGRSWWEFKGTLSATDSSGNWYPWVSYLLQ